MKAILALATLVASSQAFSVPFNEQLPISVASPWSFERENYCPRPGRSGRYSREREEGSILEVLRKDKRFSKFVEVLEEHRGLRDDLEGKSKVTLFAPTNEAIRKLKEQMGEDKFDRSRERMSMEQIIRYHLCLNEVDYDEFFDGMTIETGLRLRELDTQHQRIRVSQRWGYITLNAYARVEERNIGAQNGVIHAIDSVLLPPPNMCDVLYFVPNKFSTFISALFRTGYADHFKKATAVTAFVPPNNAWENLGMINLMYLFSEKGMKDLKKVIEYHLAEELVYVDKILSKRETTLKTACKGESIRIVSQPWSKHGRERSKYDDEEGGIFGKEEYQCPANFKIVVNNGEATITYNDVLADNGNMMLISNVLIPSEVRLPASH